MDNTQLIQMVALTALQTAFKNHPVLQNITITPMGGKVGLVNTELKFMFIAPVADAPMSDQSNDYIRHGLCTPGRKVMCGGKTYTVIKARNKKYLATDQFGKNWLIRFENCSAIA